MVYSAERQWRDRVAVAAHMRQFSSVAYVALGSACIAATAYAIVLPAFRRALRIRKAEEDEDEEDTPPLGLFFLMDPILFQPITDPALLEGTRQVYEYSSVRSWLATGSRTCPKTNVQLHDVQVLAGAARRQPAAAGRLALRSPNVLNSARAQVVRLPALAHAIREWAAEQGAALPREPPGPPEGVLRAADAQLPALLKDLRAGDTQRTQVAAAACNDLLIRWAQEAQEAGAGEPALAARGAALEVRGQAALRGIPPVRVCPLHFRKGSAAGAPWLSCGCLER